MGVWFPETNGEEEGLGFDFVEDADGFRGDTAIVVRFIRNITAFTDAGAGVAEA